MEIKPRDAYRCEYLQGFDINALQVLMTLYQPLITKDGVLVYLTLLAEAKNLHALESHARLLTLLNLSSYEFDQACAKLEEYMLLKVYVKESDSRNNYVYSLKSPLSAQDFVNSKVYMDRYVKVVGQKQSDITISNLLNNSVSTNDYKDITRLVKHKANLKQVNDVEYTKVQPRYSVSLDDETIDFDYEKFISTTTPLVFPVELRTQENLYIIGKLATIHGLSVDKMRIIVGKCVNLSSMELDDEKLKVMCEKAEPDVTGKKDVYDVSPVSFLQSKQNGAPVAMADKRILEDLGMKMKFPNSVINVLIEYILEVSNNRLNPQFVQKVAAEWARDGVKTKEDAIKETKKQVSNSKSSKKANIKAPDYIKDQKKGVYKEEKKASKETIEEIKKMQDKKKG